MGIIIVALVMVGFLARNLWLKPLEPKHIAAGQQLALKNMNWQVSGESVVLGISTTCHFCTESAGFYRQLVQACAVRNVRTIAVLPQSPDEAKRYLADEAVMVNEIRQASLTELQITGAPTLLLVDSQGTVRGVWIGKLPTDKEKEVLSRIGSEPQTGFLRVPALTA